MTTNGTVAVTQISPLFYPKSFTHFYLFFFLLSNRWRRSCISCCSPRREGGLEFCAPGSGQARRREPAGDEQEAAEHVGRAAHQEHASAEGMLNVLVMLRELGRHPYDTITHNTECVT